MNANIMKTQIFLKMEYDLKGHIRSNKAFHVNLFSSNNSSVKSTLPLILPPIVCTLLCPIPLIGRGTVPYLLFGFGKVNFS